VTAGVPWDVVWALEDYESLALTVIIGECNGGKFNWDRMNWIER
jgi:hypothetical protein